jgi:hypothetical protein
LLPVITPALRQKGEGDGISRHFSSSLKMTINTAEFSGK